MFEWKRKELLAKEVEFFGGTVKGFVSCYAKQSKPRIKMKLPETIRISLLPAFNGYGSALAQQQALQGAAIANIANQGYGLGGSGNLAGMGSGLGLGSSHLSAVQQGYAGALGVFGR